MITELTQEQVDSIPNYSDDWIKHGLDTSPINKEAAIEAVKLAYRLANRPEPKFFIFTDGPIEAMRIITAAPKIELSQTDFEELSKQGVTALSDRVRGIVKTLFESEGVGKLGFSTPFYGQHEAEWLSLHQFFADHFGLSAQSAGLRAIGRECGWVWMFAELVIISAKPTHLSLDAQGRLHNEKRAAIEYADGTKVYAFNGVRIPEEWVLQRDTIDPKVILECPDVDKRAAGIALYGYSRMKHALDYQILEGDPETDIGALVTIKIPGLSRRGRFLEAICPRNGPVFLGVPETNPWGNNEPIVDSIGAQAFLARLPRSAFETPPLRT